MLFFILSGCHTLSTFDPAAKTSDPCGTIMDPVSGLSSDVAVEADRSAEVYGAQPTPYQVHLTWAGDPSTTQAILWRTDVDTLASSVEFGIDTTYGASISGASFLSGSVDTDGRTHEVRLCDLLPNTTYHYRVGGEGGWSPDYSFQTAPVPGTQTDFSFGIVGDSRDNQATWGEILQAMETHGPSFYLFSGDMVDLGVNMEEWNAWLDAAAGVSEYKPIMTVHGNHEFFARQYFGFFALPNNEQWYSFDYGQLHVAALNDTVVEPTDIDTQATWLQSDLQTSQPLKVVFHHIPAYTSCNTHPPNENLQEKWSPVEEAAGVVIDFTGHNHNYERSVPLRSGVETSADQGTTYIVSAGAGADLYDNDLEQPYTAVAQVTFHYVIVVVSGNTVTATAYDLAGNVLDTFSTSR